jgi:hypothetical protein
MSSVVARGAVSKPQRDGAAGAANRELSADDVWKESIEQLLGMSGISAYETDWLS